MTARIGAAVLAQVADLATFGLAVAVIGITGESSATARALGPAGAVALKAAGLVAIVSIIVRLGQRLPARRRIVWPARLLTLVTGAGMVGVIANVAAVVR